MSQHDETQLGGPGPNCDALAAPLLARAQHLEDHHHIIPPFAIAIVLMAEAAHSAAELAANVGDKDTVGMITRSFLAGWYEIGNGLESMGAPMGLTKNRVYIAARYTFERTIKENQALEHRLHTDPSFARTYAEQVAGALTERLIDDLKSKE